jgi:type IV pilus assembly protein PilE
MLPLRLPFFIRRNGFTLIEVMIVVAIVAILAAIAVPAYNEQIARSRRADAKTVLLEAAQFAERYYSTKGSYTGLTLPTALQKAPKDGTATYYNVALSGITATEYTLTASPSGAMASDKCGNLGINQAGTKTNGTSGSLELCWQK